MMRILLVRPSSLGDVVHALPVVRDIARAFPHAIVDWLAEEAFAPIVRLNTRVDTVTPVALRRWRHHLLAPATWQEMLAFRRVLRASTYDVIVDFQEQVKGALMAALARGPVHGFDRHSVRESASTWFHTGHHAVGSHLHFQERCRTLAGLALGIAPAGPADYGLTVPVAPPGLVPTRPYAVIVHVTSRDDKRWPDAHWHHVITAFDGAGLDVMLPWGSEAERVRSVVLAAGHANARVPARHPLRDVAALLAHAEAVVGVDTGLVHLAAALRVPTVAIFTTTDARLAGVSVVGAHARDLGGNGDVPAPDAVVATVGALLRVAPRC